MRTRWSRASTIAQTCSQRHLHKLNRTTPTPLLRGYLAMQKTETMARTLRSLFGAFATDATDDMVRGYVLGVGDIAPEKLQIAVARAIRECERLPRPVELRRLSGERTGDDRAIAAWAD